MFTLLDGIYYRLRKEEIEKANIIFKKIKIDTILKNLTKNCWEYNIQYETIIKTSSVLIIKLVGMKETVVFKYRKTDMVTKTDMELFMSELDENRAKKGVYITTGRFEERKNMSIKDWILKKDIIFQDNFTFIKKQLGLKGKAIKNFNEENLKFFKFLPE